MENIKEFLRRNPGAKVINFDEKGDWLAGEAPNFTVSKTMTREEILEEEAPKAPKAPKK